MKLTRRGLGRYAKFTAHAPAGAAQIMASSKGVAAFVDVLNASRRIGYPPGAVRGTISA